VAAERERIGRDLHDILGHSLTAISIKAGLAGKLVDHDPDAAKAEIGDIEEIARQALADVRSTATGYREIRVATEIASARSVLLAGGIEARVPTAVDALPAEVSELFGYVVREAVTNVVRHSEATTCTIEVSPRGVTVQDDGRGFAPSSTVCGSGLEGLAHRMEAVGGRLVVESRPRGGTSVRAELDQAPTPAAATRGSTMSAFAARP
jgi:two-component system, NarL family, sensor histidine kinase DesK